MTEQQLTFYQKVSKIQAKLNAPKNAYNKYGSFYYRSLESILEGLKPYLDQYELFLTLNDEIFQISDRFYVKGTATISDGEKTISTVAYAREDVSRKGMDASQLTGSCSSYARKYALGGLFAIDDNKDADSRDNTESKQIKRKVKSSQPATNKDNILENLISQVPNLQTLQDANNLWVKTISHVHGGDLERSDIAGLWDKLQDYCDFTFQASYDQKAKQFIVNEGATFQ